MTEVPPPPPGVVPPAGANPAAAKNWMGITSLILGILSLVLACCGGFLFGAGAAVLGYLGKQAAAKGEASNGGLANVGFILGIIGVAIGIVGLILNIVNGFSYNFTSFN